MNKYYIEEQNDPWKKVSAELFYFALNEISKHIKNIDIGEMLEEGMVVKFRGAEFGFQIKSDVTSEFPLTIYYS